MLQFWTQRSAINARTYLIFRRRKRPPYFGVRVWRRRHIWRSATHVSTDLISVTRLRSRKSRTVPGGSRGTRTAFETSNQNTEVTDRVNKLSVSLARFRAAILLLSLDVVSNADAGAGVRQVCDVEADYALGVEDYSEAIRLNAEVEAYRQPARSLSSGFCPRNDGQHNGGARGVSACRGAWTEKLRSVPEHGVGSGRKRRPGRSDRQSAGGLCSSVKTIPNHT
jgi:hypothetical protein